MPTKVTVVGRTYDAAVHYFEGSQSEKRRFVGAASGYAKTPLTAAGRAALVGLVAERHANPSLRNGGAVLFALGGAVGRVPKSGTAFVHRDARFSVELVGLWDTPADERGEHRVDQPRADDDAAVPLGRSRPELRRSRARLTGRRPTTEPISPAW